MQWYICRGRWLQITPSSTNHIGFLLPERYNYIEYFKTYCILVAVWVAESVVRTDCKRCVHHMLISSPRVNVLVRAFMLRLFLVTVSDTKEHLM